MSLSSMASKERKDYMKISKYNGMKKKSNENLVPTLIVMDVINTQILFFLHEITREQTKRARNKSNR
jgi:hypothetical protein